MCARAPRRAALWIIATSILLWTIDPCLAAAPEAIIGNGENRADRHIFDGQAEPQSWATTGRDDSETRFSPLSQINEVNAGSLGLAWSYDLDTQRGQESTPLEVAGVVYTTSAWSKVQAFDVVTGKLLWQFDPKVPGRTAVKACCDVVNRGAAYWNGRVYVGTIDGRLIAVDAKSGQQVWSTQTTDPGKNYTITGAPRVVKGRVIIGNAGGEYAARGYVSAYDAENGALDWRFYTVPGQPGVKDRAASDEILDKLASHTWAGNWWSEAGGGGGATVWDSMAFDPDLDLLYVGTGNASYWNRKYRSPGDADNLFASSILALRPETGEYVWHFQEVPGDEWDYDTTQHMILTDLSIGGRLRKVLLQASKDGVFYVLDRATGKLISATPYIPINWAKRIDPRTGRPDIVPEARYDRTGKPWDSMPGGDGGHDWQPMAFNKGTGLVYFPAFEVAGRFVDDPHFKPKPLGMNLGLDVTASAKIYSDPHRRPAKGYLVAWDPVRQREVWRAPSPGTWNGGVLTTAGGLVVEGDSGGFLNIYEAKAGRKLWAFDCQTGIVAAPVTYAVNGVQYLTIVVGAATSDAWSSDGTSSNDRSNRSRVLTFMLGGTAKLPPRAVVRLDIPKAPDQFADESTISQGHHMFDETCMACHGLNAVGTGIIPDLRHSSALADKDTWKEIVWNGILEADGMVSWKSDYTLDQVEAIRAYVISQARHEQHLK